MNTILLGRTCFKQTDTERTVPFEIVGAYLSSTGLPTLLVKRLVEAPTPIVAIDARKVAVG